MSTRIYIIGDNRWFIEADIQCFYNHGPSPTRKTSMKSQVMQAFCHSSKSIEKKYKEGSLKKIKNLLYLMATFTLLFTVL